MNQNNFQGVRQVTPEEIARVEGIPLTHEELQKTQVLNLKEFSETVRFEKLTSKKPAIILAVIGALFITFGTTFQVVQSLNKKADPVVEPRSAPIEEPREEVVMEEETTNEKILTCNQTIMANPDGTDTSYTITYKFEEEKLVGFRKSFQVTVTPGSPLGPTTVQNYLIGYQPFLNQQEGYQISVVPIDNGLVATIEADYLKLDLTIFPPIQQTHFTTKIDYPLDTPFTQVQENMKTLGFNCQ